MEDLADTIERAKSGDVIAQRELAIRYHSGDGVSPDAEAAISWLKRAAENGDPWSQTTYAIQLRQSDRPEQQSESVVWLNRATAQGDTRARAALGAQQILGIGTSIDKIAGLANVVQASLEGESDASELVGKVRHSLNDEEVAEVISRVHWPVLTFALAQPYRRNNDATNGAKEPAWLSEDRGEMEDLFLATSEQPLNACFGTTVRVVKIFVGLAIISGEESSATSVSLRDILLPDGWPVWWKPSGAALDAVANTLAYVGGRPWARWLYQSS